MIEPPKRRFSLRRMALWTLGGAIVLGIGVFGLDEYRTSRRLGSTVADLDATDPGWRLEEIEAARAVVPERQNSAALCRELRGLFPAPWPDTGFVEKMTRNTLPERLDDERMKSLAVEMKRLETVRLVARRLADMPRGRHRLEYHHHPLATRLSEQSETRELVVPLFLLQMVYLSNGGKVSEAVRSGRSCVCAGRSMGDEPILVSQLIRGGIVRAGLVGVEGALSLGEANESELVALDKLMADEEAHNGLLVGLRGERASMEKLFSRLGSGSLPSDGLNDELGIAEWSPLRRVALYPRWKVRRHEPMMLEMLTRLVDNARLPPHAQIAGEKAVSLEVERMKSSSSVVASFFPAAVKLGNIFRRKTASVSAMRGLIAVERYRMKFEKWPAKLADVVPEFLKEVPTDPFDGTPLRMTKVSDGVIVYSIGVNGVDDGGKLERMKPTATGIDIGYQLWDKGKRRQRPSKPEEKR